MPFPQFPFSIRKLRKANCPAVLTEITEREKPFVWAGGARTWQLVEEIRALGSERHRVNYLRDLVGRRKIHFLHIPAQFQGSIGYSPSGTPKMPYYTHEATVRDFLRLIAACWQDPECGSFYAQSRPLRSFPELRARTRTEECLTGLEEAATRIWIGGGNHRNCLHFDCFGNFVFQIAGRKRFCLLPPETIGELRPTPPRCGIGGATGSLVDLLRPHTQDRRRLEVAVYSALVAVLEPGDILWIPPNWWHHVESQGFNIMVNSWVHMTRRRHLDNLENHLRRSIVATIPLRGVALRRTRLMFRRAWTERRISPGTSDHTFGEGSEPLNAALSEIGALPVPTGWETFLMAAYDYYLFASRASQPQWAAVIQYATNPSKDSFITKEK